MFKPGLLGPLLYVLCLPTLSVAQQQSQDAEKIVALERKWTEAYRHRDVSILSSLLAEDFVITVGKRCPFRKITRLRPKQTVDDAFGRKSRDATPILKQDNLQLYGVGVCLSQEANLDSKT